MNPGYKFKRESKNGPKKSKYQIFKEKLAAGTISNIPRARSSSSIESPREEQTSSDPVQVANPIIAVQKFPMYEPDVNAELLEESTVYNHQLLDALAEAKNILLDDSLTETSLMDSIQDFMNSMDSNVSFNLSSGL